MLILREARKLDPAQRRRRASTATIGPAVLARCGEVRVLSSAGTIAPRVAHAEHCPRDKNRDSKPRAVVGHALMTSMDKPPAISADRMREDVARNEAARLESIRSDASRSLGQNLEQADTLI